jgi:hypothetical protein
MLVSATRNVVLVALSVVACKAKVHTDKVSIVAIGRVLIGRARPIVAARETSRGSPVNVVV